MDIICAKCGKHFSSIEAARDHRGNCRETSKDEPIRWVPAQKSKMTPVEWENLMRLINTQNTSPAALSPNIDSATDNQSESTKEPTDNQRLHSFRQPFKPKGNPSKKGTGKKNTAHRSNFRIPTWLIALLFIFGLSITGLGISIFVGIFIPLWVLLGFSLIYSVEKWFSYQTRRHKSAGKLYRLFLNLAILAVFGLLIWSGIKLFSQQFTASSLIGSLVFLGEFIFFVWMWRVVSRNSWRWPSMKLTVFSLLAISIVFAFAGVQPMSSYKDTVITKWDSYWAEQKVKTEERLAQAEIEEQKRLEEQRIAEQKATEAQKIEEERINEEQNKELQAGLLDMEHEVLLLVNLIRSDKGIQMLQWDDALYTYSKSHSEEMARINDMFHTDMNESYAENCWMGSGNRWEAADIVESWMGSPKHRTWLLCPSLKRVAVGIVYSGSSTFASWTFWRSETTQSDWWYQYTPDNPPEWWY